MNTNSRKQDARSQVKTEGSGLNNPQGVKADIHLPPSPTIVWGLFIHKLEVAQCANSPIKDALTITSIM